MGRGPKVFPNLLAARVRLLSPQRLGLSPEADIRSRKEILEENIAFQSNGQSLCVQLFVFTQFPGQILQNPVPLNCPLALPKFKVFTRKEQCECECESIF